MEARGWKSYDCHLLSILPNVHSVPHFGHIYVSTHRKVKIGKNISISTFEKLINR